MRELVFLLEEESAKAMLEVLVPRLLPPELATRFIVFEGKHDLLHRLRKRLRGYLNPEAAFLILIDQDSAPDCRAIKERLVEQCDAAGRRTFLVRVACRELEAFYLADLAAVAAAFGLPSIADLQQKRKYREPDRLESPARELERLTAKRYQKVSGSRAIAPHLDPDNPRSPSFGNLVAGIRRLAAIDCIGSDA